MNCKTSFVFSNAGNVFNYILF